MNILKHVRPRFSPTVVRSPERRHLANLAGALTPHGVWARVIEEPTPFLRVSNPLSNYAIEDLFCERRRYDYVFRTSFGVDLGTTDDLYNTAGQVAWLVGAVERRPRWPRPYSPTLEREGRREGR